MKITLMTSDEVLFMVEPAFAFSSETIKYIIEDCGAHDVIPLPMVRSNTLAKLIEYWEKQREFERFQAEFVKVEEDTLFEIIRAADYLNIKPLLDLTGKHVANMKGNIPYDIRNIFNLEEKYWVRGETSGT